MIDPNMPAFPMPDTFLKDSFDAGTATKLREANLGVPVRLWLAAQALTGILARRNIIHALAAKDAFNYADALIAEYNRTEEKGA